MKILVIADHGGHVLNHATFHAVTAGSVFCDDIDLLVVGEQCETIAKEACKIVGVSRVLAIEAPEYHGFLAECVAKLVVSLAEDYSHIVAAATSTMKNLLPRVAALLDVTQMSDVIGILSYDTFEQPIYAGNAVAVVRVLDTPKVLTVRPTEFAPAKPVGGQAEYISLTKPYSFPFSEFIERSASLSDGPALSDARVVITAGRGVGDVETFEQLEHLANRLGAAIGASRAAVDAGFTTNDKQVGQTGVVVAPELYIAAGVSGAAQHVAGIKGAKVIVAINKDEQAPIFECADYGLVGDLKQLLPELLECLAAN